MRSRSGVLISWERRVQGGRREDFSHRIQAKWIPWIQNPDAYSWRPRGTHHSKARLSNVRKNLLKCKLLFLAMPVGRKMWVNSQQYPKRIVMNNGSECLRHSPLINPLSSNFKFRYTGRSTVSFVPVEPYHKMRFRFNMTRMIKKPSHQT